MPTGGMEAAHDGIDALVFLFVSFISGDIYRGTSLTRKRTPLGPYHRPMPRVLGGS